MGQDFVNNTNIKEVDFATVHAWPDNWLISQVRGAAARALSFLVSSCMRSASPPLASVLRPPAERQLLLAGLP